MASMALQPSDSFQSSQSLIGKFRESEIPELAGNLPGIQEQTKVRRRDARCDNQRLFLNVVWNQPVMFCRTELGEVPPDSERGTAQEPAVAVGIHADQFTRGTVEPVGDKFAACPERQNGSCHRKGIASR